MTTQEWFDKIYEWTETEDLLKRLPYMFIVPLARKLAEYEAAQQSGEGESQAPKAEVGFGKVNC